MAAGISDHPAKLGDRYELSDVIGQGGMAVVWRAFDRILHRQVAAKVLPGDRRDPVSQRRFYREARHVASLSHPNIVRVFDFGTDGDHSFIIMEYVRGGSLRNVLSSGASLSVAETCRLAVDTLGALEHAHEHGIIHRDVKPGNLLIDADGVVKVTDFGIARAFDETSELTVGGTFIGTLGYAAPEQLSGETASAASDLYSLGCVLFQCLTGRLPYESDDAADLAVQHRFAAPPSLTAFRPDVPDEVAGAIARSLATSPRDRHATAKEMADELVAFAAPDLVSQARTLEGGRTADAPTEDHEPKGAEHRKRSLWWAVAGIAAVAIVAAGTLWAIAGTSNQGTSASEMASGGLLAPGQSMHSPNGRFVLIMQRDGNLVSYRAHPKTAVWESGTSGYLGSYLVMQSDGDLVLYPFGKSAPLIGHPSAALWCSGTSGHPGAVARFLNDGDLAIESRATSALWTAPRDPPACMPTS